MDRGTVVWPSVLTVQSKATRVTDQGETHTWAPVRRVKLSDEIADQIVDSVVAGRFSFGERLPPERELAKYLNVGRPTLREAITALSAIGLLEVRPGEGTFVVDQHSDFISKAFSWAVLLDTRTIREVAEARIAIESELARLAARHATDEDIVALRTLVEAVRDAVGNSRTFTSADIEFHFKIAETARNVTLARILRAIQSLLRQWIDLALKQPDTYTMAVSHHAEIFDAIANHDESGAAAAMRTHLEEMAQKIQRVVDSTDGS